MKLIIKCGGLSVQRNIPWMIVLTKGDLLDCDMLAQCVFAVRLDLAQFVNTKSGDKQVSQAQNKYIRTSDTEGSPAGDSGDVVEEVEDEDEWESSDAEDYSTDEGSEEDSVSEEYYEVEEDNDSDEGQVRGSNSGAKDDLDWERENTDVPNLNRVPVQVISSSTGAGIQKLWRRLCGFARQDAPIPRSAIGSPPSTIVREHRLAALVRSKRGLQNPGPADPRGMRVGKQARENSRNAKRPPVRIGKNRRTVRASEREARRNLEE